MIKPITSKNKALICFVVDMSCSLAEKCFYEGKIRPKSEIVSQIVNTALTEYIHSCNRGGVYKEYFDIIVLGYNGAGVVSLLEGIAEQGKCYATINQLVNSNIPKYEYNGLVNIDGKECEYKRAAYKFVDIAPSDSTPMLLALDKCKQEVALWLRERGEAMSLAMITNISDGIATDASDEELLDIAKSIKMLDDSVIFSNIHIGKGENGIIFPSSREELDNYEGAALLYDMSSELPPKVSAALSSSLGIDNDKPLRAMSYNASLDRLSTILQIGTLTINQDL